MNRQRNLLLIILYIEKILVGIYSLLNTINNRENNSFMRNEDSSQERGNEEWSGTSSYEEAQSLLIHGYEDPVKNIKSSLAKNKKLTSKIYNSIPKPIVQNRVVGFVPNVPNALKGLPESMITLEKLHKKRKTISIIYATGGSCGVESDVLASAGAALVSAINLIELSGVQTVAKLETVISNLSEVLSISLLKGMDEDTLSILKNELSEAKDMTNNKYAKAIINGNSWDF